MPSEFPTPEHRRLAEDNTREHNWKRWGPYLAERQWGTVREDYSPDGDAWSYFPHEHSRSRAYRWGEDGLLGWTDRECRLCFAPSLWNGKDSILKERLFGLTGPEGNHGEDVKEYYYYLDSTPTHSYAKALYRYPQAEFPYNQLVAENANRGLKEREYELVDTNAFDEERYFDVEVEYAKRTPDDILIRITAHNRGPEPAAIWLLPTFWLRNTWIWGCAHEGCTLKPRMQADGNNSVVGSHETLGRFRAYFGPHPTGGIPEVLFTENETNTELLHGTPTYTPYTKDAFHRYVIDNEKDAVNPDQHGTKVAAVYKLTLAPGECQSVTARMAIGETEINEPFGAEFESTFSNRLEETDEFYKHVIEAKIDPQQQLVSRRAYAGLLWTKQFFHYIVADWLKGDKDVATPPSQRKEGRNHEWRHMYARDVLSMPDKWEYPWFAAWDLAFHMIPMAKIDPDFAKQQLLVLLREWYMHPNGQLPAYEWEFDDVNPPVHAWACYRVYQMTGPPGKRDRKFLAKAFQRLLLNFTWWVNRIDHNGDNVFAGGFLGLDNIGIFDRSKGLPKGTRLEQADGTAWMAFYCGTMLSIALELAREDTVYEEMASKFLDHFVRIIDAINSHGGKGLWDEEDGFYYDHLHVDDSILPLKVRSLVGLLPLIAVEILDEELVARLPEFYKRIRWFLKFRHDLTPHVSLAQCSASGNHRMLLAIPTEEKLKRVLSLMLDESEFLSPYGIRSLSKHHETSPFELSVGGQVHRVAYVSGESDSQMFGGNSNWRGPIWFPTNFLLIEALERYHYYFGDDFQVECPTGSGNMMNLKEVSCELNQRLTRLFIHDDQIKGRPCYGKSSQPTGCKSWQDEILFHEYFDGDTGEGLGASHQTGWTALVANCIEKQS